jgi:hypothetical protein
LLVLQQISIKEPVLVAVFGDQFESDGSALPNRPRLAPAASAQWRDAPNIGQGFWSPDDDQKQANCKERPSPQ